MNSKIGGIAAAFGFVLSLAIGLISGTGVFAVMRALVFAAFFFVLANILIIIARRFLPDLLEFSPEPNGDPRPGSRVNIVEEDGAASMLGGEAGLENLDSGQGGGLLAEPDLSSERFSYGGDSGAFGETPPDLGGDSGFSGTPFPDSGNLAGPGENPPAGISSPGPALDQRDKNSYNRKGDVSDSEAGAGAPFAGGAGLSPPAPRGEAALPGDSSSMDVLPDFEAMSHAFLASAREAETGEAGDGTAGQTDDVFQLSVTGQSPDPSSQYYTGNKPVEMEGDFPPKQLAQAIQTVLKRDEQ
ncbi:MAG: phage holin family protein [Spirochaetaceae bacterium]|jgi:hypothetical protein|nr:phage holin family protein [Spirochaetaceae bacterium]